MRRCLNGVAQLKWHITYQQINFSVDLPAAQLEMKTFNQSYCSIRDEFFQLISPPLRGLAAVTMSQPVSQQWTSTVSMTLNSKLVISLVRVDKTWRQTETYKGNFTFQAKSTIRHEVCQQLESGMRDKNREEKVIGCFICDQSFSLSLKTQRKTTFLGICLCTYRQKLSTPHFTLSAANLEERTKTHERSFSRL